MLAKDPNAKPQFICTTNVNATEQHGYLVCSEVTMQQTTLVTSSSKSKRTQYIQGGALNGGDGSKKHPWNKLTDAEGKDWTTLIILKSEVVLYGGITMYDGQTIEGQTLNKSFLGNLDDISHNGDVIVVNGKVTIRNLIITTAFRSAIEALHAEDLIIENVVIEESNRDASTFFYDWTLNSTTNRSSSRWAAISFFGGPTTTIGLQSLNTRSGKLSLRKVTIRNSRVGVIVGSGDVISLTAVAPKFYREYYIIRLSIEGPSIENGSGFDDGLIIIAGGGSVISGTIDNSTFKNLSNKNLQAPSSGVTIISTRQNRNYPGRGEVTFGTNLISNSDFENIDGRGVVVSLSGILLENNACFIVKNNRFRGIGASFTTSPPAVIESGSGAINLRSESTGSGYIKWLIFDNGIFDVTGFASGINAYFVGRPFTIVADIQNNLIDGPTTGITIFVFNLSPTSEAVGRFYIAHNLIRNVDSALVVAGSVPGHTDVEVVVEKNCLENTGNRQAQIGRSSIYFGGIIPGSTDSYYGGTIIFGGGLTNPAVQNIGVDQSSQGIILDFGNGRLGSAGRNNFINTAGAHVWVEAGLNLFAEHNWFDRVAPIATGGGIVDFQPELRSGPRKCQSNDSFSSSD